MRRIVICAVICLSFFSLKAQIWTQLDGGLPGTPTASTSLGNHLAAVSIIETNDSFRLHRISIWNGYYWHKLPLLKAGSSSIITSLTYYKDALYIAGRFDTINGIPGAKNIIRWKDRKYSALPQFSSNLNDFTSIQHLVVYNNLLLAIGPFAEKTGINGKNIAFYNGSDIVTSSSVHSFGSGVDGNISSVYSNREDLLVLGGRFNSVNDTSSSQIAFLYKGKWHRITSNNVIPQKITASDTILYFFGNKIDTKEIGIYRSNGNAIDTLEDGISNIIAVFDIIQIDGVIYASGIFQLSDNNLTQNLIRLDGDTWEPLKNGTFTGLRRLENYKNDLVGTGPFVQNDVQQLNYIALYRQNIGLISGQVFFDKDKNCEFTTRDEALNNMLILVMPGNHIIRPGADGKYFYLLEQGQYTLRIIYNEYWNPASCNSDSITVKLESGKFINNLNFAMLQKTGIRDLSIKLSSSSGLNVTKGRYVAYTITYENRGSENVDKTSVYLKVDPRLDGVEFKPAASAFKNDTIVWDLADFYSGELGKIECVFKYSGSTDENLNMTASIPLEAGEANPEDNESSLSQELSEDEYEFQKSIISGGTGDSITLPDSAGAIEYIISFANYTSDTIFTVYVVDTIRLNHSMSFIQTTASSHSVMTEAFPGAPGQDIGILVWTFEDINLYPNPGKNPEIVTHQGFVSFKIGLNKNLSEGMVLSNRASVAFDYYDPQLTNWTYALVDNPRVGIQEIVLQSNLIVYPNPAGNSLSVELGFQDNCEMQYDVQTISGQIILSGELHTNCEIDVSSLSPGIYVLTLKTESGYYTIKFLKS